jgi:hypothetical protein
VQSKKWAAGGAVSDDADTEATDEEDVLDASMGEEDKG